MNISVHQLIISYQLSCGAATWEYVKKSDSAIHNLLALISQAAAQLKKRQRFFKLLIACTATTKSRLSKQKHDHVQEEKSLLNKNKHHCWKVSLEQSLSKKHLEQVTPYNKKSRLSKNIVTLYYLYRTIKFEQKHTCFSRSSGRYLSLIGSISVLFIMHNAMVAW
jgi:hypothetical protein